MTESKIKRTYLLVALKNNNNKKKSLAQKVSIAESECNNKRVKKNNLIF